MVDGTGTTTYDYDNAGRLTERSSPQGTVYYTYDDDGRKVSEGVNLGTPTTFTYDNAGRMLTVVAPSGTTTYTYNTPGRIATVTYANGAVETRDYDATTGDLEEIWHRATSGGTTLQKFTYTFDNLGRKLTETTPSAARAWDYDAAGQLIQDNRTGSGAYTASFTYDNAGNRATRVVNGGTETYTYNDANLLTGTSGASSKSYTYDNDGNLTSVTSGSVTTTVTWDGAGRVTQVTDGTYTNTNTYNGLGQRIGKVDSTGTLSFILQDDAIDSGVLSDGLATYNHGLGVISEVRGGVTRAYHPDGMGATRALSAGSGSVSATREMGAFGLFVSASGTQTPFGFGGQYGYQYDVDSKLMRLGHRFYDGSTGRFLSRDPIFDGYNWYTYCNNDPVNNVDPEGLGWKEWVKPIIDFLGWGTGGAGDETISPAPRPPTYPEPPPARTAPPPNFPEPQPPPRYRIIYPGGGTGSGGAGSGIVTIGVGAAAAGDAIAQGVLYRRRLEGYMDDDGSWDGVR